MVCCIELSRLFGSLMTCTMAGLGLRHSHISFVMKFIYISKQVCVTQKRGRGAFFRSSLGWESLSFLSRSLWKSCISVPHRAKPTTGALLKMHPGHGVPPRWIPTLVTLSGATAAMMLDAFHPMAGSPHMPDTHIRWLDEIDKQKKHVLNIQTRLNCCAFCDFLRCPDSQPFFRGDESWSK